VSQGDVVHEWDGQDLTVGMSPRDFEAEVKRHFDSLGIELRSYESQLRPVAARYDGDYEIDVTAAFEALGIRILVLVECKHQRRPVAREVVQLLWAKLDSIAAHKGIVVSSSGFQEGAVTFARKHGIALFDMKAGSLVRLLEAEGVFVEALPPFEMTVVDSGVLGAGDGFSEGGGTTVGEWLARLWNLRSP
jgi:restriction system protein